MPIPQEYVPSRRGLDVAEEEIMRACSRARVGSDERDRLIRMLLPSLALRVDEEVRSIIQAFIVEEDHA